MCSDFQAHFFDFELLKHRNVSIKLCILLVERFVKGEQIICCCKKNNVLSSIAYFYLWESFALERPLAFEIFFNVLKVKGCQIERTNQPKENKIVCQPLSTQCPRLTAANQTNCVTLAHRNKNGSV